MIGNDLTESFRLFGESSQRRVITSSDFDGTIFLQVVEIAIELDDEFIDVDIVDVDIAEVDIVDDDIIVADIPLSL